LPAARAIALLSLALGAPLAAAARDAPVSPVEIVSVATNTGQAAGGHVAVRIGGQVYHYEVYDDGLLHLTRESWSLFLARYADLENRSLRALRLATGADVDARLGALVSLLEETTGS